MEWNPSLPCSMVLRGHNLVIAQSSSPCSGHLNNIASRLSCISQSSRMSHTMQMRRTLLGHNSLSSTHILGDDVCHW
jgi:hypothetical protein